MIYLQGVKWSRAVAIALVMAMGAVQGCGFFGSEPMRTVAEVPGTAEHAIQVGPAARTFLMHVPSTRPTRLGRAVAYPVVIVLHGSGASGETVRRMSRMDSIADAAHFIAVYPNGMSGAFNLQSDWNAGECCGPSASRKVDDVGFVGALIDSLARSLPVDRNRIYVAGFSDGGRMAYRLGCVLSQRIAAIAVIAGSVVDPACAPSRAVPLVAFHGTADRDVSYGDTSYAQPRLKAAAVLDDLPPSVRFWSATNGCTGDTRTRPHPHVVLDRMTSCRADVVFYTIEGGLHAWPGGDADGQATTHEISASVLAWRFFQRHSLR